ncbi:hypothetical protein HF313_04510 [Massilia atriviolacea]|uniref:Imm33-like domain-containing protein n=1 Tax=Massilia atriviolacea TaxID=2495579 RepID=A0A430HD44_9BURK|nr:hypothetical protein [Massilia atriviolacea]RSZ55420.1 hypothetical protein EJB06_29485 [Massilia atriviolacea]
MGEERDPANTATRYVTSTCHAFGHPEFSVRVSGTHIPEVDVQWLLDYLAQAVARGERFSAGDSLQVGWMATIVQAGPGGTLCVTEPDMRSIPIAFVDAVDRTLAHLRSQGDIVASIDPAREPVFPSLRQTAVVHVDYRTSGSILLSRFEPQGARSGWWITDCEGEDDAQDPTRFTTISLYRLALDRPELVKLFALPPGLQVFVEGTRIHVIDDEGELIALPGSFLDRLQQRHLAG